MRKLLIVLSGLLSLLFVTATSFSLWYFVQGSSIKATESNALTQKSKFRVIAIIPESNDQVINLVKNDLTKTFTSANIAIEILFVQNNSLSSKESLLIERAILSKPHAIILYPQHDDELVPVINLGISRGVKIITIIADVPGSKRNVFIGTNPFELGQTAADELFKLRPQGAVIGLILSTGTGRLDSSNSVFLSAFYRRLSSDPNFKIVGVEYSDFGAPQGEELSNILLNKFPDLNVIVSANPDDTVGVAQTLIDSNKIKDVSIVDFDRSAEVDELKQKGIISVVISKKPENIAKITLDTIFNLIEGSGSSAYIDPGIEVIE